MFQEFREVIASNNFVILDTETTGLEEPAEICGIAIVDFTGTAILDTLVKPRLGISSSAYRVHGISDLDVKDAPDWLEVKKEVLRLTSKRKIITYNAVFDRKMFHLSDLACGVEHTEYKEINDWLCAMLFYAEYYGEWDNYHGNYRWQKLGAAARQLGIVQMGEHSALGDALTTYAVIRRVTSALAAGDLLQGDNPPVRDMDDGWDHNIPKHDLVD